MGKKKNEEKKETIEGGRRGRRGGRRRGGRDPLAQTFNINDDTGVFLTKIDLFFQQKDDQFPVKFQINETEQGQPTATSSSI